MPTELDAPFLRLLDASPAGRRLAYALLAGEARPCFAESVVAGVAALQFANAGMRAVVVRPGGDPEAAKRRLIELARAPAPGGLEIAWVGDDPGAEAFLREALPRHPPQRIDLWRLSEDGRAERLGEPAPGAGPLGEALQRLPAFDPGPDDWAHTDRWRATIERAVQASTGEHVAFVNRLQSRRPIATWVVLGIIGLVFLAELATNATDHMPALRRLGAIVPARVQAGEWWRLPAATFLHGDAMHVLFNGLVLYGLGSFIEKLLGTWRFLVLYGASALAGAVASSMFLGAEATSVGASGALWGLLAANAVLAFRPNGLLPQSILKSARSNAMTNLVMNVVVSFLPHVDRYAHFAGGAVGALLVFSGVLLVGMPPLPERATGPQPPDVVPLAMRPIAIALSALLVAGLGLAIAEGRVWELGDPPVLAERQVPDFPARLDLPVTLEEASRPTDEDGTVVTFGELRQDPAVVIALARVHGEELAADDFVPTLEQSLESLRQPDSGESIVVPPAVVDLDGVPLLRRLSRYGDGPYVATAVRFTRTRLYRIDVTFWPDYRATWEDVAGRIAVSIEEPAP